MYFTISLHLLKVKPEPGFEFAIYYIYVFVISYIIIPETKLPVDSPYNKKSDLFSPEYEANTSRYIRLPAGVIMDTSSNIRLCTAFAIKCVFFFLTSLAILGHFPVSPDQQNVP